MSLTDLLDCFDDAPTDSGPGEEWLAGHAAGLDEGRARAQAEAIHLQEETARAIADLTLTFEEAHAHVLARLAPLFAALSETAVPLILRESLGAALLDELARAARTDTDAPLALLVAPEDAVALEAVLPLVPGTKDTLNTDPGLAPARSLSSAAGRGRLRSISSDLATVSPKRSQRLPIP